MAKLTIENSIQRVIFNTVRELCVEKDPNDLAKDYYYGESTNILSSTIFARLLALPDLPDVFRQQVVKDNGYVYNTKGVYITQYEGLNVVVMNFTWLGDYTKNAICRNQNGTHSYRLEDIYETTELDPIPEFYEEFVDG